MSNETESSEKTMNQPFQLSALLDAVPEFNCPDNNLNLYVWYGWHPMYPKWSRSCWTGETVEAAKKHGQRERSYYWALIAPNMSVVEYREPIDIEPWFRE